MQRSRSSDYQRIEKAILFLDRNFQAQPGLAQVARHVGLSEYHFQRLFRRWAGISPKRFLQFLTVGYAKELLQQSRSLLDVTYEAGLSSPSRLHDLFVTVEAITPGEFKSRGAGLTITWGVHLTPFGECVLGVTEKGICGLVFVADRNPSGAIAGLRHRWPGATFIQDWKVTEPYVRRIFSRAAASSRRLTLFLKGTNFQIKVWEALLRIPSGAVVSYSDLARYIGSPGASRAVGTAVANNPIAFVIPCHRVIRNAGIIGQYRWGSTRKKAILGREAVERNPRAVNE